MLPVALTEKIAAEIVHSRMRVLEALSEACVEAAKDEPDADVIVGHVLDVLRALDRGESFAEVIDLAQEVEPS